MSSCHPASAVRSQRQHHHSESASKPLSERSQQQQEQQLLQQRAPPPTSGASSALPAGVDAECVDWDVYQAELEAALHAKDDAYPAGAPEYAELQQFITRLHRHRQLQK